MVSTTSSRTEFNLDVDKIIEDALDPLGGEHQSGIDSAKARRALNLVLIELQNKNIPLSKIGTEMLNLTINDSQYTLDDSIIDVMQANISVDDAMYTPLTRYSLKEFNNIPNQTTTGRPTIFTTERLTSGINIKLWQIPDSADYSLRMLVAKRIEDVDASYQKLDVSYRYLPFIIAALSYKLSLGRQGIPADIRQEIKMNYETLKNDAFDEDRERADVNITIGGISGW